MGFFQALALAVEFSLGSRCCSCGGDFGQIFTYFIAGGVNRSGIFQRCLELIINRFEKLGL